MRAHWQAALPPLMLLTFGLLIFRELALTDFILGRGDTFVYFYPYWAARDAAFRAGQLPLWTPNLYTGAPLLANPQLGALYPPNWLTISLNAPDAVRVSILLHIGWACAGAYALGRGAVRLGRPGALVVAAAYGLGGYVGAHVEQINQLQGLAWFPWVFLLLHRGMLAHGGRRLAYGILLGGALALQFLAGHTQTVFICGVGAAVYLLAAWRPRGLLVLAGGGLLALGLASAQLIPTLELIEQGARSGGLAPNAALSFSFSPWVAGRGLLPSYDGKLFSEYIAYIGVSGVVLAVLGLLTPPSAPSTFPRRRAWGVLGAVAILLALGAYNPLNWALVQLPGFDLFRVPARWLALYALAAAALAGLGLEALTAPRPRWAWLAPVGVVLALAGLSLLAGRVPEEINGPARPTPRTLAAWGAALALTLATLRWRRVLLPGVLLLELAAASLVMPYNDLVPPDVWDAQRFSISQLLAYTATDADGLTDDGTPPGRLLSISGLFFDPGDQAALSRRYRALGMSPLEERYSFVAAKLKETLSPNLPLAWGVPSVDGFGGGLLPTRHYTTFMQLVYPPGQTVPVDGRLRENLAQAQCRGACLPATTAGARLLGLEFLLVDKTFDIWHEGVAFDTALPAPAADAWSIGFQTDRRFAANSVQVLYRCLGATPCTPENIELVPYTAANGTTRLGPAGEPTRLDDGLYLLREPVPLDDYDTVKISDVETVAVTLTDTRLENQFVQLRAPYGWQRVLSSDIKLYRQPTRNRAFVTSAYHTAASDAEALDLLRAAGDDWHIAVIHDTTLPPSPLDPDAMGPPGQRPEANLTFNAYHPARVDLTATTEAPAMLVLGDSYYPGWRAWVDGEPAPVYRANVNFRAISLPIGASHVIFEYTPRWFPGVFIFAGALWAFVSITWLAIWRRT